MIKPRSNYIPVYLFLIWFLTTSLWWGLAFYPNQDLEWLEVARKVCFGSLANGLPDTYGWLVLILAPLSFLLGLVVTWYDDFLHFFKRSIKFKRLYFLSLPLVAIILVQMVWVKERLAYARSVEMISMYEQTGDLPEAYPIQNKAIKDFTLLDHRGQHVSSQGLRGKTVLLTFAFANCTTVCPMLVTNVLEAARQIQKQSQSHNHSQNEEVVSLIITLDPWRDTPRSLPAIAERWRLPDNTYLLGGEVEGVKQVISDFEVPTSRDDKNGDIMHPALTFVINKKGKIAYTFNNAPIAWLVEAVARIH